MLQQPKVAMSRTRLATEQQTLLRWFSVLAIAFQEKGTTIKLQWLTFAYLSPVCVNLLIVPESFPHNF